MTLTITPHRKDALDTQTLEDTAMRAAEWLAVSGIQMKSDDIRFDGGFPAWIDGDTGTVPYVYAEISGYMVTLMTWLYSRSGDARFLTSAKRSADWLIDSPIYHAASGAFRCLQPVTPSRFDHKWEHLYAFDCGVILNGLVDLYRVTREQAYLAASHRVAEWLVGASQRPDGSFRPMFDLAKNEWIENNSEWSLSACGYHTKISLGLANLSLLSGERRYADAALAGCDFALGFQQHDGRFVTFPGIGGTNSHPHSYTAEGLWAVGNLLDRADYVAASARATEWLFSVQSPDGFVPRHFHTDGPLYNERVDILSQALRLAEIHRESGALAAKFEVNMERLLPLIVRNQAVHGDKRYDGAFYFGRLSDGAQMLHANVWVSAFAAQALLLRHDRLKGKGALDPIYMV